MDEHPDGDMALEHAIVTGTLTGGHRVRPPYPPVRRRVGNTAFRIQVHLIHLVSNLLGDDVLGRALRRGMLSIAGASFGHRSGLMGGTFISRPSNLSLGYASGINRGCHLDLEAPIQLHDHVLVGHGVTFVTTVHAIVPGMNLGVGASSRAITVGDRAWIGANSTVLPGVSIGHDAIVAAGSTVTRDVPPNTLVGGIPAKVLKTNVRPWLSQFRLDEELRPG